MILVGSRSQSGLFRRAPALLPGLLPCGIGMAGQLVEAQALPSAGDQGTTLAEVQIRLQFVLSADLMPNGSV